jgi:hypothetical protein
MRTIEGFRHGLAATPRRSGLVGDSRSWAIRPMVRDTGYPDSGPGQRAIAAVGLGRRAPGMVSQGSWTGGGGLARPAPPTPGEEIRLRRDGRATHGLRALLILRHREPRLGQSANRSEPTRRRTWSGRATADTDRRCHHARPHFDCRRAPTPRDISRRADPRIRARAHAEAGRDASPAPRPLRGRSAVGGRRCAQAPLVPRLFWRRRDLGAVRPW